MKKLISFALAMVMLICSVMSVGVISFADEQIIEEGGFTKSITLNPDNNSVRFSFTPEKSGICTLSNYSDTAFNSKLCVYDNTGESIMFDESTEETNKFTSEKFFLDSKITYEIECTACEIDEEIEVDLTLSINAFASMEFIPVDGVGCNLPVNAPGEYRYYGFLGETYFVPKTNIFSVGDIIRIYLEDGNTVTVEYDEYAPGQGFLYCYETKQFSYSYLGVYAPDGTLNIGDKTNYYMTVYGYDLIIPVTVTEEAVFITNAEFSSEEEKTLIYGVDGTFCINNGEEFFEFNKYNFFTEGDKITATYSDESTKTYVYYDKYTESESSVTYYDVFVNEDGEILEGWLNFNDYGEIWEVGKTYNATKFVEGLTCNIPVKIINDNVVDVKYIPANESEKYIRKYSHDDGAYYSAPYFDENDKVIIVYDDSTEITYTLTPETLIEDGESYIMYEFKDENGKPADFEYETYISEEQQNEIEMLTGNYSYTVSIRGKKIIMPAKFAPPVKSIEFTPAKPKTITTDNYFLYNGRYHYFAPDFEEGDKLIVNYEDEYGSAVFSFRDYDPETGVNTFVDDKGNTINDIYYYFDDEYDVQLTAGTHTEYTIWFEGTFISVPVTITESNRHDHLYTPSITRMPTCTENGERVYTCSCGDSYTEGIAKIAHNFDNNVQYCAYGCGTANPDYKAPAPSTTEPSTAAPATQPTQTQEPAVSKLKSTTLSKLTAGKKQIKVTWKKATGITGYQIQYSTDKKFKKGVKSVNVKGASKTSTTIKKLTSKKTYYVRIRTYKGKNYSAWSKAKSVKVK